MRIIVIGAGEVGSNIAASLAEQHEVVVVDQDSDQVESLTYSLDVLPVEGDGADTSTLREAGVEDADVVIASTDDDETNIVCCGTVRTMSDAFSIARVRNTQYLDTWRGAEDAFGVGFMVCTVLLTAESIVRVIGLPTAQDVDSFADGAVRMAQFEVPAESTVAGQTVREADVYEGLTFAALVQDGEVVVTTGETEIEAGDQLIVIGTPASVRAFGTALAPEASGPGDIVIVGGSDVGFHVARLLEDRGFRPRLIEQTPERARELAEDLPNTTVLESDATDREFLERENVGEADIVITALDSDEKNLLAGLLTKRLGAQRTVSVTETGEYVELFEAVGVDIAINPREATAEEITRFTREQRTENVAIIEGDRAEIMEVEVDESSVLAGHPIRESVDDLPEGVVIGAVTRDGEFVTPRGDTVIEPGDHVVAFVHADVLEETTEKL